MDKKIFDERKNIHIIVAYNIKKYRKQTKITQAKLSEMVDLSHEFIRRIESKNGQKSFSLETVYRISLALDVPIYKFFEDNTQELES